MRGPANSLGCAHGRHAATASGPALADLLMNGQDAVDVGLAALSNGHEAEALPVVAAAARLYSKIPQLWQVLGLLHRALGDLRPALRALATAARLAPADARIAHAHARAVMEAGLPSLALFDKAWALSPSDGELIISRTAAQLAEGRAVEAGRQLEVMLEGNPLWLPGHAGLARIRWMAGDQERFTSSYERALSAAPQDMSLRLALLDTLIAAERYQQAAAAATAARGAVGPHPALDVIEAICASELGDAVRADRLFEALRPPCEIPATIARIRHLLRTGRADAAAAVAEPLVTGPAADQIWPYLSVAWRLTQDPRSQWLDGDPRLVAVYDLADQLDMSALAQRLRAFHNSISYPLGQSVRGGTQTDGPLFARIEPEIRAVREVLANAVGRHIVQLAPVDRSHPYLRQAPDRVRFAGSWSVRLLSQGRHTNHIHPQGWLSSAFYVSLPQPEQMGAAPAGWLSLGQPPAELGIDLPPQRMIEPRPGRLVVFPSLMWHGTMPFEDGERLSLAFDVAPRLIAL